MLFRVIDIETTGLCPPAEILEIGRVDIIVDDDDVVIERPKARLYRPLNGIPPEAMAVHPLPRRILAPILLFARTSAWNWQFGEVLYQTL